MTDEQLAEIEEYNNWLHQQVQTLIAEVRHLRDLNRQQTATISRLLPSRDQYYGGG